ncbi:MAG: TatD family hydrolase [Planctomycetota bacterium]|nr:MAG: TatD family hydrolase [Planctomycetota bacterium]
MPIDLVDTHCHLTAKELFPHRRRVITDAVNVGVSRMITVSCSMGEIQEALATSTMHSGIWVAAGIHPHQASRVGRDDLKRLAELWREDSIVAVGEIGLDFYYDFSPRDMQQTVFEDQLDLAQQSGLPVIIHSRNAHDLVVRLLVKHGYVDRAVVFHCFSGTTDEAAELRAHGWRTSFTGIITFKNSAAQQETCVETPMDQLMFESDAPYLSPEPVRRMRPNEPANVVHTIRYAAQLRGESFETLARATTANAVSFFRLK